MKALVVIGSATEERRFGITSGLRVAESLSRRWEIVVQDAAEIDFVIERLTDRPDLVVPVGFGLGIEDGAIHTLASALGLPCAGPDATTGRIAADKQVFSNFVRGVFESDPHVDVPRGFDFSPVDTPEQLGASLQALTPPLVIKPNTGGSSVGLVVVNDAEEARHVILNARARGEHLLVQELVAPSREFSITCLDTATGTTLLPVVEILRERVFGFEDKFGDASQNHHVVPAQIDDALASQMRAACLKLHRALRACGLTRYDLLVRESDDRICFLECNPIPGLLTSSIACDSAAAAGIAFDSLAHMYADSAFLPRLARIPSAWGQQPMSPQARTWT